MLKLRVTENPNSVVKITLLDPVVLTEIRQICSDIGKVVLENEKECENQAPLGVNGYGGLIHASIYPSGCVLNKCADMQICDKVYWNTHQNGKGSVNYVAICRNPGI